MGVGKERRAPVAPNAEQEARPKAAPGTAPQTRPARPALPAAIAIAAGIAALCGAAVLLRRLAQRRRGSGALPLPPMPAAPPEAQKGGPFQATVGLKSLLAPGDGRIQTQLPWDDRWFFQDPAVYNPGLSQALATLSFLAVSESYHYKHRGARPADMEHALAALGFSDCSTRSYQFRSRPVDQVLGAVTGDVDVVAYAFGRKDLPAPEGGRPVTILLVAVRGSYGSEWFSNINLPPNQTDVPPQVLAQTKADIATAEGVHHRGFEKAAKEILRDLVDYTSALKDRDVKLVLCGHSRGGSVANYVAAHVIRLSQAPFSAARRCDVFCYTLAAPTLTSAPDAQGPLFAGIFNIINPCDPVPRLPLWRWGYRRYGVDAELPGIGDPGFPESFARFSDTFERLVGAPVPYDPADRSTVNDLVARLGRRIPSRARWESPVSKLFLGLALATLDQPVRVFASHYESVYLAWLQSIRTDGLRFLPPGEALS